MKLIRISTDDNSGYFETAFNQSIDVEPMSKIGLNNFTANLKPIEIKSSNDYVYYFIAWGDGITPGQSIEYKTVLINATYNKNNFWDLLDEMTSGMNFGLVYTAFDGDENILGGQWRAFIVDKRVNVEYLIGYNQIDLIDYNQSVALSTTELAGRIIYGLDAGVGNNDWYQYSALGKYNTSMGNGYIRCQINKMSLDGSAGSNLIDQGFVIGLSSTVLPNIVPSEMTEADITYGFGVGYDGVNWTFYRQQGSVTTNLAIVPHYAAEADATNANLEVMINGSVIDFSYTDNTGARQLAFTYQFNNKIKLYPFMAFHSSKTYMSIVSYEWTFDPFSYISYEHDLRPLSNADYFKVNPDQYTIKNLNFSPNNPTDPGLELYQFLGYNESDMLGDQNGEAGGYNFIAENLFKPSISERNFILLLQSINIESYDSSQKQRSNIISSVISANENDVISDEPNIIFIDLLNKEALDLRNITMRLVDTDFQPVELIGRSVATVLLAGQNEKSF